MASSLAPRLVVLVVAVAVLVAVASLTSAGYAYGLEGRTVCVDPGHGGYDPGAVGYVVEKHVNLEVALKLKRLLEADGARVVMTRSGDYYVSLAERAYIANAAGCDIFVSIHANAAYSRAARGFEVYHYPGSYWGSRLASLVYQEVLDMVPVDGRGVKSAKFYVLRHTRMPAILVELGFVTNPYDAMLLASEESQWAYALGILYGIQRYFGVEPHNPLDYVKPVVLRVRIGLHPGYARFVVDMSREASYTVYYWASPPYLIVYVKKAVLGSLDSSWVYVGNGWYKKKTGVPWAPYVFVKETSQGVVVVIATYNIRPYKAFTLDNPYRIVVDITR